jgi:hypothetical protein
MILRITEHAIDRYRERVGRLPCDPMLARMTLFSLLFSANSKRVRKAINGERTAFVPLQDCFLVFSYGVMVTVLERKAEQPRLAI